MRIGLIPRTRWGLIRMIALAGILPLLFLIIWLFTVRMPGPAFSGPLLPRTVRFVFFLNEEPPSFPTADMGSRHYATAARARNDQIVAMLSIESIGYYDTEKGSQRYPFPLNLAYPDACDFIGFVSNLRSRSLLHRAIGAFRAPATLPTQGAAAPAWVPGVWWSAHWSFWRGGYPGFVIPVTAPSRNPSSPTPPAPPAKPDYARLP